MSNADGGACTHVAGNLAYLRLQGRSDMTVRDRRRILASLGRALPAPLCRATSVMLWDWREALTVGPAATVNYVSHAACFYHWLAAVQNLRPDNPAAGLPVPRLGTRLPRPIAEAALMDVLAAAPRRIRPWIVLAGWAGLRCQEIAWLRAENVRLDAIPPYVLVTRETAKGIRERAVPLGRFAAGELAACQLPRRGWCWTRRDGLAGPNSPARVSELINELLHDCGYPDTAHTLRHRCLTQVQRIGRDIRVTQEIAGHSDPAQTALYTLVSAERSAAVLQELPAPRILRAAG